MGRWKRERHFSVARLFSLFRF